MVMLEFWSGCTFEEGQQPIPQHPYNRWQVIRFEEATGVSYVLHARDLRAHLRAVCSEFI